MKKVILLIFFSLLFINPTYASCTITGGACSISDLKEPPKSEKKVEYTKSTPQKNLLNNNVAAKKKESAKKIRPIPSAKN